LGWGVSHKHRARVTPTPTPPRKWEGSRISHTLCMVTETFGPFLMVW
jgi:hypothetical protein